MLHRLILMLSALFLMFAVFGFVFSYGAYRGDNFDVAMGNLVLGLVMIGASVATLLVGLRLQRKFDARVDEIISTLSAATGTFEAEQFATALNITVDDARDVLGKRASAQSWKYEELGSYNARYYIS